MNENVYLIQFDYNRKTHDIPNLSYNNFGNSFSTEQWMSNTIEEYIQTYGLHKDGAKVSNANLIGKGCEVLVHVDDFSEI